MMKKINLLWAILLLAQSAFSQEEWTLANYKDDVKVYLRETPNCDVKTFKAEAQIDFPLEDVLSAILDLKNAHKWIDGIASGQMIKTISDSEFIFRQRVVLPFPYDDREVVQRVSIITESEGRTIVKIVEANDAAPPLEGHVRMEISHGSWQLIPNEKGCFLVYIFVSDPGENIPAWMINQTLPKTPVTTLVQLREYLASQ